MSKDYSQKLIKLGFEVADKTVAMLAFWDNELICRYANHAYFEWFGKKPEEIINKMKLSDLLGPEFFAQNLPFINAVLSGQSQVFQRELQTPSGQFKKASVTYSPAIENGKIKGFFVHATDISPLVNHSIVQNDNKHPDIFKPILSANDTVLDKIVGTLKDSLLTEFPGIEKLARKHFISISKLKRDFKEKYNCTPFTYYRNLQMVLAEEYIREKKYSKKQMASVLNFSNPYNFSICYRKYQEQKKEEELVKGMQKSQEDLYKAFIKQTPFAMAMLDCDLKYIACSDKWVEDHFDSAQPGTGYKSAIRPLRTNWREVLHNCLQGKIETCEEELCQKEDGTILWLKWDIRPWYNLDYKIGGLLIFTQNITEAKQKDTEAKKITEILNKTNDITRIGVWKRNLDGNVTMWSAMMQDILEVPDGFEPNLDTMINFYKEGKDREIVERARQKAVEEGIPFDIEADLVTAKGNSKRVRVIGYPEFLNGKCERMFGVLQDITHKELAKLMVVSSFMFDLFQ